jgi:AraC-like DNA-binding protein
MKGLLSSNQFRAEFFCKNPLLESVLGLFDHLPNAFLYVKDTGSHFVHVNQQFLAIYDSHGVADVLGKTDRDFFPPALAESYIAEDRHVLETGKSVVGELWLVPHTRGTPQWFVSSKTPLFDSSGKIIGLAGVMFRVEVPLEKERYFGRLKPALDYLETNYGLNISINEAAKKCGLPATTFNRQFRELLRMTPTEYLLTWRIENARRMLEETQRSMADIAVECGFSDQSHFTKRFRRVTGLTPLAYQKRFKS